MGAGSNASGVGDGATDVRADGHHCGEDTRLTGWQGIEEPGERASILCRGHGQDAVDRDAHREGVGDGDGQGIGRAIVGDRE